MKITVEDGAKTGFSETGNTPSEVCFNALRSMGLTDENILKDMYAFSSQFVTVKEEKPKK